MTLTLLLSLLNNKWVLWALGSGLGACYVYWKGYSSAKSSDKLKDEAASSELQSQVDKAQAANSGLEAQKEATNETIDQTAASGSILNLIGLFNALQSKVTGRGNADKDTKQNP